jgi:methanogenic corrinoid protein MtbC1
MHEIEARLLEQDAAPRAMEGTAGVVIPAVTPVRPTVQVVAAPSSQLLGIMNAFVPLLGPLGTGGLVVLLMAFLLLERENLRDRLISLLGRDAIGVSTQVLDDARRHLGRYLLMQAVINSGHGVCVGLGLWSLGVPNALLWGLLSTLLRFVPYVGPLIAAALPIALSLAAFDGWTRPLLVIAFFGLLEIVSNNLVEPWLYGSSAGMSPLAVVVTATFWTWLWGAPGLVLATPLTICLVVVSRHVPQLGFLNLLLSDVPGLDADLRFYQRLMDLDQDGAIAVVQQLASDGKSLVEIHDDTIVPSLAMVEIERHADRLDAHRATFFGPAVRQIAEELHDGADKSRTTVVPTPGGWPLVLCIPARTEGDEVVAGLLARVLSESGVRSECLSNAVLASELADAVERLAADVVCISALPPQGLPQARYLCKRLRERCPRLRIVVGLWSMRGTTVEKAEARLGSGPDLRVVTTFAGAMQSIGQWPPATCTPSPSPIETSTAP